MSKVRVVYLNGKCPVVQIEINQPQARAFAKGHVNITKNMKTDVARALEFIDKTRNNQQNPQNE